MMFRTHVAFGFLAGLFAITFLHPANQILFISLVVVASAFPDIDHPNSKIGKRVKFVGFLFEHRGFFHSVFAVALFTLLIFLAFNAPIYAWGVLIGYASHLIADCFTVQGIMPFHPFSRKAIRGFVRTGTTVEVVFFWILIVADVWKLIKL